MQSRRTGAAIALGALALAMVLFVVLQGDDSGDGGTPIETQTTTTGPAAIPVITVRDGEPVGGVQELEFTKGDRIRFAVRSDVADEVHLHGYDIAMDVEAGGRVEFDVPATLEGGFEVELEESHVEIAEISVSPG